ncbi:hypothetical protein [Streptomyces lonarensis]|uniref:Uncharacterized protein n=1 Tax=Streptomyces lonarensis TaxID=700599 RepID=A0A7X6CYA8_9ACTN|nr:hypothetical protein [Streptomyces lonarensis]NJQ04660.1 hypothetical protein [Streptomyces lonarensis]
MSPPEPADQVPWAGKAEQAAAVAAADPSLALATSVHDDRDALDALLARSSVAMVLRPEFSGDMGSAVFHRPGGALNTAVADELWASGRVVSHPYRSGVPHFANGLVSDGKFVLTDCWRCFTLPERERWALTSVVNPAPDSPTARLLARRLRDLPGALGAGDGPFHVEVLVDADAVAVVKFSTRRAAYPLPELCALLGVDGQRSDRPYDSYTDIGFAGDYSFRVPHPGVLVHVEDLSGLRARPSYAADELIPQPGDRLTPGAPECAQLTLLLRHHDEFTIYADIDHYQQRHRNGVFRLTTG